MTGSSKEERSRAGDGELIAGAPRAPSDSGLLAGILELGARATSADRVALWVMQPPAGEGGRIPEDDGAAPDAPTGGRAEEAAEGLAAGRLLHRAHLYHAGVDAHAAGGLLLEEHFPRYFRALDEDDLLVVDDVATDPRTAELTAPYARPLGIQSWIDQRVRMADGRGGVVRFERGGGFRRWTPREVRLARAVAAAVGQLPRDGRAPTEREGERRGTNVGSEEPDAATAPEETGAAVLQDPSANGASGRGGAAPTGREREREA